MKNNNYIRHALYLRNSIAYDHDFCYTSVKWWYLHAFFCCCWYFHFSGCYEGKRPKNGPRWQKVLSVALHISGTIIIWLSFIWYTCEKWWYLQNFDSLGFLTKWQKILSHFLSQELHLTWLCFWYTCKIIISPAFFFFLFFIFFILIFSKFGFFGFFKVHQ